LVVKIHAGSPFSSGTWILSSPVFIVLNTVLIDQHCWEAAWAGSTALSASAAVMLRVREEMLFLQQERFCRSSEMSTRADRTLARRVLSGNLCGYNWRFCASSLKGSEITLLARIDLCRPGDTPQKCPYTLSVSRLTFSIAGCPLTEWCTSQPEGSLF
jgi:hypothetical protein